MRKRHRVAGCLGRYRRPHWLPMTRRGTRTTKLNMTRCVAFIRLPVTPAPRPPSPALSVCLLAKFSHFESWGPLDAFDRLIKAVTKLEDTQVLRPLDALDVPVKMLPEREAGEAVGKRRPLDFLVEIRPEAKHLSRQKGVNYGRPEGNSRRYYVACGGSGSGGGSHTGAHDTSSESSKRQLNYGESNQTGRHRRAHTRGRRIFIGWRFGVVDAKLKGREL